MKVFFFFQELIKPQHYQIPWAWRSYITVLGIQCFRWLSTYTGHWNILSVH